MASEIYSNPLDYYNDDDGNNGNVGALSNGSISASSSASFSSSSSSSLSQSLRSNIKEHRNNNSSNSTDNKSQENIDSKDSNSDMQFRPIVVSASGDEDGKECIYAVVNKTDKNSVGLRGDSKDKSKAIHRNSSDQGEEIHYSAVGVGKKDELSPTNSQKQVVNNKDFGYEVPSDVSSTESGNAHYGSAPAIKRHDIYETLPDDSNQTETKKPSNKQLLKKSLSSSSSTSTTSISATTTTAASSRSSSPMKTTANSTSANDKRNSTLSTFIQHHSTNNLNHDSNNKVDDKKYIFSAVFLGSMVVDVQKLQASRSEYMAECIKSVAGQTSVDATKTLVRSQNKTEVATLKNENGNNESITLSRHRGMNVLLELENHSLKLIERKTKKQRMNIPLNLIRLWGIGKGPYSREFAIISRDLAVNNTLCRVFLCEDSARIIASTFQHVCDKMAKMEEEKTKNSQDSEKRTQASSSKRVPSSESLTKSGISTIRSNKSDGSDPISKPLENETDCTYLGMMEVNKPTGMKILEHAVDMVKTYVCDDNWLKGKIKLTINGVYFKTDKTVRLSCPVECISFAGISTKHKNFAGLIVSKNKGILVHVFSIEPDCLMWFENMKFICKLHSSKYDKSMNATMNKKWK